MEFSGCDKACRHLGALRHFAPKKGVVDFATQPIDQMLADNQLLSMLHDSRYGQPWYELVLGPAAHKLITQHIQTMASQSPRLADKAKDEEAEAKFHAPAEGWREENMRPVRCMFSADVQQMSSPRAC